MGECHEYVRYDLRLDDEIIAMYKKTLEFNMSHRVQSYVFEFRTNFKLKRNKIDGGGADIWTMGSERFASPAPVFSKSSDVDDADYRELLPLSLSSDRLGDDYQMPFHLIQALAFDALAFAKQTRDAYKKLHHYWLVIPVVIELDVVTLQREGEPLDEAVGRAIRPESLFPLHLIPTCHLKDDDDIVGDGVGVSSRKKFLARLKMKSTRALQGLVVCPVCLGSSSCGSGGGLMSSLPCGHICHTLCVYRMLKHGVSDSCPACAAPIPTDDPR